MSDPQREDPRSAIRRRAAGYLGTPYLWGGADKQGIDCSAFISRAWGIGRQTTDTLAQVADRIGRDEMQPGDAMNLTTRQDPRGYGHVRMFDGWADQDHRTMWVYESSTATGGVARRKIPYDAAYTPMRLRGLTGEPPQETAAQMHAEAPPAVAERQPPGRPPPQPIAQQVVAALGPTTAEAAEATDQPATVGVYRATGEVPPNTPGLERQGAGAPVQPTGGAGVDTSGDRPPSELEPTGRVAPSSLPTAAATSSKLKRIQAQLDDARHEVDTAQTALAAAQSKKPAIDPTLGLNPGEITALEKPWRDDLKDAQDALAKAQERVRGHEKELAAEEDSLTKEGPPAPKTPAAPPRVTRADGVWERQPDGSWKQVADLPGTSRETVPKASRTYKSGGVTYTETAPDSGGFSPLPPGVENRDPNAMTDYQAAELPIQRQNADTSRISAVAAQLHAQVAKGTLDFTTAKTVFDYVVAQQAPVEEGGQLYRPGRQPSSSSRQTLGLSVQPYSVTDAAGFFGRPELNQYVHGSYPFGAGPMSPDEYHQRQAGTFPGAGAPAGAPPPPAAAPPAPGLAAPALAADPGLLAQRHGEQGAGVPLDTALLDQRHGEQAGGGFQPNPAGLAASGAGVPSMPSFGGATGGGAAVLAQQQQVMAATDKIRQHLLTLGIRPEVADQAARQYLGVGPTMAQTPF